MSCNAAKDIAKIADATRENRIEMPLKKQGHTLISSRMFTWLVNNIYSPRSKAHKRVNLYCIFHIVARHIVYGSATVRASLYCDVALRRGTLSNISLYATLHALRSPAPRRSSTPSSPSPSRCSGGLSWLVKPELAG